MGVDLTVAGVDLFTTAQAVVAATLVAHGFVLRPWTARADLLLTVEMIDKDLTAEIDRGALPLADPLVAGLQRCLSLSRKRSDARESLTNLTALLSPDQFGRLDRLDRRERLDRLDRLDELTPGVQHILLEYLAELSAATSAYLRITRLTRRLKAESVPPAPPTQAMTPSVPGPRRPLPSGSRDVVRHSRDAKRGWHRPQRHPRNPPIDQNQGEQHEGRRILDLSTGVTYDSLYDNRSHDRLSLDRASLDRLSHNRLMYENEPYENPS